ncbi:alanine dehydrogenase [Alteraurantiacibacter buctensis]|uniref:Alanine dehydrogenase n=1 Tax=Alteraurantiacibacter buctensis TaxID=1503981 RepID=A0A844YUY2_9SPHN|nr:alanine dehydrogenase [Alteraurantiacibacter buctensis]MXO70942.1 alanine dehydrogenase [Alteraurantiacibacter buctensis]
MRVGTVKEIKNHEYRVGLTPESVRELAAAGQEVWVETGAGLGIGADDAAYVAAGGTIIATAAEIFAQCEMVVKVKEPQPVERAQLRQGQILYTYLHLAPDPEQTADLVKSGVTAIAYETVTGEGNTLPLLKPMSQVAGRMAIQAGATALEKAHGGRGVLLGGVPGVLPAKVVVIGGGVVGFNAAQMAVGLGADVTILDRDPNVLERLDSHFVGRARTLFSGRAALASEVAEADLVIGAVLVPGAAAPKLVTREMLGTMRQGAVLVDVAIDQGGCFETSRATTHADPTYVVDGVVHYCVANMPGAVARTSTYALNNVTLPHALRIAKLGWRAALAANPHLAAGLNVHEGKVTYEAVARDLGYDYVPVAEVLG